MDSLKATLETPTAGAPGRLRTGAGTLTLLALGHFSVDMYSSALSAFQPLLVSKLGISLAQAGALGGAMIFSSSLLQPVYGYLSDRYRSRMFAALGPLVAAVFISALGSAPSFGWLVAMAALSGAGIASFHPQASARATFGIDANRGQRMAIFISGGTLGYALGPAYFSTVVSRIGMERSYWAALPGVLVTLALLVFLAPMPASGHSGPRFDFRPLRAVWRPLTILYLLVYIRSIVQVTFAQFIPLYLNHERGYSITSASMLLSAYLAAGALGGFLGGHMSDRFGGRLVILVSMIASMPFLAVFLFTEGWISAVCLVMGGFILLFTIPVNVVMAQELAPAQSGTISALMMGFAWGAAGLVFVPLTGWLSDRFTLHHVLAGLLVFPLLGFLLTLKLDKDGK